MSAADAAAPPGRRRRARAGSSPSPGTRRSPRSPSVSSEIEATSEAHTVLNAHYTGTFSLLAYFFPLRFFHRLGATEVDPDTICNKAGHVALDYVYGTSLVGFDPRTARDAACILVWGANPSASAPHAHEHWLPETPGTVIVVDPIRTETAELADLHLQPFPGSDAALAFALLHVIAREGLVDERFVREHTVGWEELEPLLADCTPAWGEQATGVPAAPDRGGRRALRPRPLAPLARAGPPAPAHRRQRHPRLRAPAGRDGQPRQARRRLPLPERNASRAGSTRRTSLRRTSPPTRPTRSATWISRTASRTRAARRRSSAGTSTSPPRTRSRRACTRRSAARTCSRSRSTSSRPTRPTSPTTSCRRRASSSSTISSPRTSTSPSRRRSRRPSRWARRCRTWRSSAGSPGRWATTSPSSTRATPS